MSHLRDGDVDLMVGVIEDARRDEPGEAMPWLLLEGLQRLVHCDVASYQDHDLTSRCSLIQDVADANRYGPVTLLPEGDHDQFWALWWASTCSWPQRAGDLRTVTHWGDFFASARARLKVAGNYGMIIYYPPSLGRNFDELRRVVIALQTADALQVATPADWRPGDAVIVPPPGSCGVAKDRVETPDDDVTVVDWFFSTKAVGEQTVMEAIRRP